MANLIKKMTLCAAVASIAMSASAETLRWSSAGDSLTLDPHSQNEGPTHTLAHQIYDSLVFRNMDMELTAGLATKWEVTSDPSVWKFTLREGVSYHDGSAFTSEDVVFSLNRAKHENADVKGLLGSVVSVEADGDFAVLIKTDGPNPLLPNNLTNMFMMDKTWAETHDVEIPQDYAAGEETYAVRNANGTGPYVLESREPDVKTVLKINENYWGKDMFPMEVTEIIHTPIQSAATRVAALLSGEIDFLLDPPVQDLARLENAPGLAVAKAPQNRTIFLGMDQGRDELRNSNVKGKNPFADQRVREAMNMAIDRTAIQKVVMRGQSVPAGMIAPPFVNGYTKKLDNVAKVDKKKAMKLLADAGYEDGFSATLQCPNDRYINDEAICQAAVGMLNQIGLDISLESKPKSIHFADLQNGELDFYMLGWGVPTMDSHYVFHYLVESRTEEGGAWNHANFSNAEVDANIKAMPSETDLKKRDKMIADVWKVVQDEVVYLPLHHQVLNWAMKDNIEFDVQGEDQPHFMYMTFK
jgi:peptide/nickel transport system substrate-binding protein